MTEYEYIERETVKRHIRYLIQDPWNHQAAPASWADAYRQMIDILDDEAAADVRPVKRGKWLAASRLVLQPNNNCDGSTFWSIIMPPEYKPDNALLVVSALCDCCGCWHVAVRDAGSAIDDYHTGHIPLPWFCPTCGADMRKEADADDN